MHIVLALLGAIGVVAALLMRVRMAADVAGELAEAGNSARLFVRRQLWRRKVNADLLNSVDDAREAAAAMMVAVAQYDGALTETEAGVIVDLMERTFWIGREEAEGYLARGRWLARDAVNPGQFLRRLTPCIARVCSEAERRELIGMLLAAAAVHGEPGDIEAHAIADLNRRLAA